MDIEEKWQGSSSFLKKRTKKLLFVSVRVNRCGRVKQASKSFLVLFFKKELLPCFVSIRAACFDLESETARSPAGKIPDLVTEILIRSKKIVSPRRFAFEPGDAYQTVYTVWFSQAIYVLHAFQKKSRKGIKTQPDDIELIRRRLAVAEMDYTRRQGAIS